MKSFVSSRTVIAYSLLSTVLLASCSDSGSVTTLDARPVVDLDIPDVLLNSPDVDQSTLRPTISLSSGGNVSLQRGVGDMWSGTINVTAGRSYIADIVWVQNYQGELLPLASKQQTFDIAADGSVRRDGENGYAVGIDSDNDGVSNFQELQNGTNPFDSDNDDRDAVNDGLTQQPATNPDAPLVQEPDPVPNPEPQPDADAPDVIVDADVDQDTQTDTDAGTETETETEADIDEDPAPVTVDVMVPRIATSDAPTIDGRSVTISSQDVFTGEWAAAVQTDNSGAPLLIDNLMIDINAEAPDGTAYRRWAAMHDGTYLYVVVLVDDDGDRNRDSQALPNDDSLELFIDGDNSKSTSYGDDDFHRIFPVQLAGQDKQSATTGDVAGPRSSTADLTLDFATGPGIGPDGIRRSRFEQDVYELRVLISSAGIDFDEPFGFELQVNDDDGGGDRDSKWGWKHPSRTVDDVDGTFTNPSLMGTLKLE